MKLCIIAPEFFPIWGGTGSYTINLVKNLPKSIEIHIVTPFRKSFYSKSQELQRVNSKIFKQNIHIHYVSEAHDTFLYNANFQLACMRKIPSLHKKYQFDLIHTHHCHMSDILLRLFNKLNVPIVCTVHNLFKWMTYSIKKSGMNFFNLDRSEKGIILLHNILEKLESFYFKTTDLLIAPSKHCMRDLINFFKLDSECINLIYNGVDINIFSEHKSNHFYNVIEKTNEHPIILFVGRPIAQKGLYFLIKTMKDVIKYIPESYFLFVGGGDFSPYQRVFNREGISNNNYQYLGHIEYSKMPEIYSLSTLFVLSSPHENCSLSILEAMSCKRTVIASNVGGTPEIIKHGKNGMLFDYGNSKKLAETIILLLEDNKLRRKYGFQARRTVVKRFSVNKMVLETLNVYKKILFQNLYK